MALDGCWAGAGRFLWDRIPVATQCYTLRHQEELSLSYQSVLEHGDCCRDSEY